MQSVVDCARIKAFYVIQSAIDCFENLKITEILKQNLNHDEWRSYLSLIKDDNNGTLSNSPSHGMFLRLAS